MKKSLKILLLVGIFSFIGIFNFSSAYSVSLPGGETRFFASESVGVSSISAPGTDLQIGSYNPPRNCDGSSTFSRGGGGRRCPSGISGPVVVSKGGNINVNITCSSFPCSITLTQGTLKKIVEFKPPILSGEIENFTPIISGLSNSINEFIPYVAYIGLGLLGVIISFVAIKRLINWVRAKIFSSFNR